MNQYAPCPKCAQSNAEKVNFTWWGGVVGPRIINHVKCTNCGSKYNGKSGRDNTTNIVIYFAVVLAFSFVLMFGMGFVMFFLK